MRCAYGAVLSVVGGLIVVGHVHGQGAPGRRDVVLPEVVYVDGSKGNDRDTGTRDRPMRSISAAIALQKASTLTCNDIELAGTFRTTIGASSGSMFVGRFLTDVTGVRATTGATISIEAVKGRVVGPVEATHCGVVSLPDRDVRAGG